MPAHDATERTAVGGSGRVFQQKSGKVMIFMRFQCDRIRCAFFVDFDWDFLNILPLKGNNPKNQQMCVLSHE